MKGLEDWWEVFSAGKHTASNGTIREWTEADLDRMVSAYDPAKHEAPLVIGHPTDNAPAWGWVAGLRRVGGKLQARARQIETAFGEMVQAGRFKKRSISVYPDGSLRHIGFLGAQPPAIKGLADIAFGEQEALTYEYQEDDMLTVEELQAQLESEKKARTEAEAKALQFKEQADAAQANFAEVKEQQRRADVETFIEQGIRDGKILTAWKDKGLAEFMLCLEPVETYEFSEGQDKQTPAAWFKAWLAEFSEHPLFKAMAKPKEDGKEQDTSDAEDEKVAAEIAAGRTK